MLDIKFNAETPKCEFSDAVDTFKIFRQKINETDINIHRHRRRRRIAHMGTKCI